MRALVLASALAGCYSPAITEGLPCSESRDCPVGQSCLPGQDVCVDGEGAQFSMTGIVAGDEATCGVGAGGLYCWGHNHVGQLGLGDTDDRDRPTLVDTSIGAYRDLEIGRELMCVIDTSNNLWCAGQGGASTVSSSTLELVASGAQWRSVGVAGDEMCAVDFAGDVWCGFSDGTAFERHDTGHGFTSIAFENGTICALDGDSHLWCWGNNDRGQVGNDVDLDYVDAPYETGGDDTWADVDIGEEHACARRTDGTMWCWGDNSDGQLGDGTFDAAAQPREVPSLTDIVEIDVGDYHSCAISGAGRAWCWGEGFRGEVGDGAADFENLEPRELGLTLAHITAGTVHTCALDPGNGAWCWGDDGHGELGDGRIGQHRAPFDAGVGDDWLSVSVGYRHGCGITGVGLQCWGRNGHGQVGDGTRARVLVPKIIDAVEDWRQVEVAIEHACAIKEPGRIACWGSNRGFRLGLPDEGLDRLVPTEVGDRDDWAKVAVASRLTCAIDSETNLWCWGDGEQAPQLLPGGAGWTDISGTADPRDDYVSGVRGGEMFRIDAYTLQPLAPATTDWTAVARGTLHTCGLRPGGEVWCTGGNEFGQLGDGTVASNDEAVQAGAEGGWTAIAAGGEFTCGLQGTALSCWGRNDDGEVGIDARDDTIVEPSPVGDGWASVATGAETACGIDLDGRLACWGLDLFLDGGWDVPVWVVPP